MVTRLNWRATTGIDRVDLAYARHFAAENPRIVCGTHYGLFAPHLLSSHTVSSLVNLFEIVQLEREQSDRPEWHELLARLADNSAVSRLAGTPPFSIAQRARLFALQSAFRVRQDRRCSIPPGAIYLSVAQHAFEHSRFFDWLNRRTDVVPVFLVHDLIPLDYPEFFRSGYDSRFQKRMNTILTHSRAIITTTSHVAERLKEEYRRRGRPLVPIHVEPLASPLGSTRAAPDAGLDSKEYFVAVSTIEPRKNYRLLINVWRALSRRTGSVPKLVIVGHRGWESEQIFRELDLSLDIRPHIIEVPSLSSSHLRSLIQNARALLMPSFAEGYGLPIVEALSLGTPIVCSDIPVFHEVSQNTAMFLSPLDGKGWLKAIVDLSAAGSCVHQHLVANVGRFVPPSWDRYFQRIEGFIESL
jgi:glycosyltransferase involved in cell wall biosynthesis